MSEQVVAQGASMLTDDEVWASTRDMAGAAGVATTHTMARGDVTVVHPVRASGAGDDDAVDGEDLDDDLDEEDLDNDADDDDADDDDESDDDDDDDDDDLDEFEDDELDDDDEDDDEADEIDFTEDRYGRIPGEDDTDG